MEQPSNERAAGSPPKRATSSDVAKASGVSRATVSYVLNNAPGRTISPRTRELVLKTARELGHLPFAPARSLRLGHSEIVLALVRDFALGYVADSILNALDVALAQRGYILIVHRYDGSTRSIPALWGAISPALVVVMGGLSVPDQSMIEGNTRLLRIHGNVRHAQAGEMQIEYLHSKGHKRIAYAFAVEPSVQLVASERFEGATRTVETLGLPSMDVANVDVRDPASVNAAVDHWLSAKSRPTAICCHNDEIALMIITALHERGLEAGKDIAVMGVDNIPEARLSLTTIEVDVDEWAARVNASMFDMLTGKEPKQVHEGFLNLIVRTSA